MIEGSLILSKRITDNLEVVMACNAEDLPFALVLVSRVSASIEGMGS
jgi:hypothetical protein